MPRRGICDQSCMSPSGLSLERQRCLQRSLELQWMGSHAWGCGVGGSGTTRSHSASCVLPLLISTGTLPSQLTCPCLAGAWKKGCCKRALLSRQTAVKDLPVELRTWEERSPSLPSDFPAPSPGPVPASCLTPFPPQQTATCCCALPSMIRGANILYTHHWFFTLFFTQSVGWNNFCKTVQPQKLLYPHSCGSQELRPWIGRKRNSDKRALQNPAL